jgi:ABC-type Na+ efflux pump permease subunit
MFDNLREDAASSPFYEEEESAKFQPAAVTKPFFSMPSSGSSRRILGMTGVQRFVIALLFFMAVCLIGGMALLVTGKIMF